MKEFFIKHIIFFVGIALYIIFPDFFADLGFIVILYGVFMGLAVVFLLINAISFVLCSKNFNSKTNTCEIFAILLSIAGGGIGSKLSTTLFGNTPSSDDVELIYHYCCELDLFLFVVCPVIVIVTDLLGFDFGTIFLGLP